jgi:hypothetical protein
MVVLDGEVKICKNCGSEYSDTYCNKCGQKDAHRLTTEHVVHDLVHVFLHADKGIFRFMSRLFFQPGIMAREYVDGKRRIFNPFQYFIFSVGFLFFLMTLSHFYESIEAYNTERAARLPGYFQKAMSDFSNMLKKYANVITFLLLPVYAFFAWRFFKKQEHNYAEHFTTVVFAMSLTYTLNSLVLIFLIVFEVKTLGTVTISLLLLIVGLVITYKQFYQLRWSTALWKGTVIFICSYLVQVLVLGLGLLVYILILKSRQ